MKKLNLNRETVRHLGTGTRQQAQASTSSDDGGGVSGDPDIKASSSSTGW